MLVAHSLLLTIPFPYEAWKVVSLTLFLRDCRVRVLFRRSQLTWVKEVSWYSELRFPQGISQCLSKPLKENWQSQAKRNATILSWIINWLKDRKWKREIRAQFSQGKVSNTVCADTCVVKRIQKYWKYFNI